LEIDARSESAEMKLRGKISPRRTNSISARFRGNSKKLGRWLAERLVRLLSTQWRYEFLFSLGRFYRFDSVVVRGDNGAVEGSLHDRVLFSDYLTRRTWSWDLLELIIHRLKAEKGGTYIDIGANIGLMTIPVALHTSCYTHAFEPDPSHFATLRLNLLRNGVLDRVNAHNTALSDGAGKLKLARSPENFGDYRISRREPISEAYSQRNWSTIEVAAQPLDDLLDWSRLARPIVIKVDTQGAEPLILMGGRKIFSRAELVIMEFWPLGMRRLNLDPLQFLDELRNLYAGVRAVDSARHNLLASSFDDLASLTKILTAHPDRFIPQMDLILSGPKPQPGITG
jgi:FkbM family methyltransferase